MANLRDVKFTQIHKPRLAPVLKLFGLKLFLALSKPISFLLLLMMPYVTIMADRAAFHQRGYYAIGGEIFVPILFIAAVVGISQLDRWVRVNQWRIRVELKYGRAGRRGSGYAK